MQMEFNRSDGLYKAVIQEIEDSFSEDGTQLSCKGCAFAKGSIMDCLTAPACAAESRDGQKIVWVKDTSRYAPPSNGAGFVGHPV